MDNQLIKIGFTWSCMSCVVQPGKEDTLTLLFFDILWNYRCFKIESPAMIAEGEDLLADCLFVRVTCWRFCCLIVCFRWGLRIYSLSWYTFLNRFIGRIDYMHFARAHGTLIVADVNIAEYHKSIFIWRRCRVILYIFIILNRCLFSPITMFSFLPLIIFIIHRASGFPIDPSVLSNFLRNLSLLQLCLTLIQGNGVFLLKNLLHFHVHRCLNL